MDMGRWDVGGWLTWVLTIYENHLRKLYKIWALPRKIQILLVWCGSFSWVFFKAAEQFSCTATAKNQDPDDQLESPKSQSKETVLKTQRQGEQSYDGQAPTTSHVVFQCSHGSLAPHSNHTWQMLSASYIWEKWGSGILNNLFKNTPRKAVEMGVDKAPPSSKVKAIFTLFVCMFPTIAGAEKKV